MTQEGRGGRADTHMPEAIHLDGRTPSGVVTDVPPAWADACSRPRTPRAGNPRSAIAYQGFSPYI